MTVIVIQAWSIVTWFKTYFRWNLWLSVHTVWTHGQEFLGPSQNLPISLRSDGSGLWNIESTYSRLISKAEWEEAIASRRSRFEFFFFVFGSSSFERWNTQSNGIEYIVSSCFILIVFRRMIWRNSWSKLWFRKTYFVVFKMNFGFAFFWFYSYCLFMIISGYFVSFRTTEFMVK